MSGFSARVDTCSPVLPSIFRIPSYECTNVRALRSKRSTNAHDKDALGALNSLLDAKNALIAVWVSYETNRLQLLLDTEALQLDERGLPQDGLFDEPNGLDLTPLDDGLELIAPGDPYRSVLLYRMSKLGYGRMPYIGSRAVDSRGVALIEEVLLRFSWLCA